MVRTVLLCLLLAGLLGCKNEADPKTEKQAKPEEQATLDLSSAEATGAVILKALKNDDKETFRRCLSPRLQKKAKECEGQENDECKRRHSLDAMFRVWKHTVKRDSLLTPETFNKYNSLQEFDGEWRLNDS